MKKITKLIFVSIFLFSLSSIGFSQETELKGFKIGVLVGSASSDCRDMNKAIEKIYNSLPNINISKEMETIPTSSFAFGLDIAKKVAPEISVVARILSWESGEGKIMYEDLIFKDIYENKMKASNFAYYIGGAYEKELNEKIEVNGKLLVGMSNFKFKVDGKYSPNGVDYFYDNISDSKNTFTSDISIGLNYKIVEKFSIGFSLGYTFLNIGKLDKFTNPGQNIEFDMSGGNFLANASYSF